jgi:RNA polymerase sigma factor (sigma-70 family)
MTDIVDIFRTIPLCLRLNVSRSRHKSENSEVLYPDVLGRIPSHASPNHDDSHCSRAAQQYDGHLFCFPQNFGAARPHKSGPFEKCLNGGGFVSDNYPDAGGLDSSDRPASHPETLLLQTAHATVIARAMRNLPARFQRLLVLREFEDLSYRELANALEIPIGTVMSRLSRARQALRDALDSEANASLAAEYSKTS